MKSFIAIVILIGLLIFSVYWGWSEHTEKNRFQNALKTKPQTGESTLINHYIDTGGRAHVIYKDNPVSQQQLNQGLAISPAYVDSLARALNISAKKITDVTVAKISAEGEAKLYKTLIDSLKRRVMYFENRFFQASYVEGTDSLKYQYHLTLNNIGYSKQKSIFSAPAFYHDIFSDDKNAVLNDVDRYTVADHVPSLTFKLQAKAFYDVKNGNLNPGAGVEFGLKRFTIAGTYLYEQRTNSFRPLVGLKFDVISLSK